jgi:hypothetical protein
LRELHQVVAGRLRSLQEPLALMNVPDAFALLDAFLASLLYSTLLCLFHETSILLQETEETVIAFLRYRV